MAVEIEVKYAKCMAIVDIEEIVKYAKCMAIGDIEEYSRGYYADAYGKFGDLYLWSEYYNWDKADPTLPLLRIYTSKTGGSGPWKFLIGIILEAPVYI